MQAIDLLLNRRSSGRLDAPAPQGEELETIIRAGLRAPDHGGLTPWRMLVAQGEGLDRLGHVYFEAAKAADADDAGLLKAQNMTKRAPMIITVVAKCQEHIKVPEVEQVISAGCAVHAMQMAAVALGYGGMWRTGGMAYDDRVKSGLGLTNGEQIVGFLYLGTAKFTPPKPREHDLSEFVKHI